MLETLFAILRTYFDICRLRLRPQDLPASQPLLATTLAAYTLTSALSALQTLPGGLAALAALLDVLLLTLLTDVALRMRGRRARFTQTLIALAGSGTVLSLLALPVLAGLSAADTGDALRFLLSNAWLGLLVWNVVVIAHIARHALSTSFSTGVGIAILYFALALAAFSLLPAPASG